MGDEWKYETVNGMEFWVHEKYGNIIKVESMYVLMVPKVLKVGPFYDLEKAKQTISNPETQEYLGGVIDQACDEILKKNK